MSLRRSLQTARDRSADRSVRTVMFLLGLLVLTLLRRLSGDDTTRPRWRRQRRRAWRRNTDDEVSR